MRERAKPKTRCVKFVIPLRHERTKSAGIRDYPRSIFINVFFVFNRCKTKRISVRCRIKMLTHFERNRALARGPTNGKPEYYNHICAPQTQNRYIFCRDFRPGAGAEEQAGNQTQMIVEKEKHRANTEGLLNQKSSSLFSAAITQKCGASKKRSALPICRGCQVIEGARFTCLLKSPGAERGARLIHLPSLFAYLENLAICQEKKS
jgi:hypothetical protein